MRPQLVGTNLQPPQQLPAALGEETASRDGPAPDSAPPAAAPPLPPIPYPAIEIPIAPRSWFQINPWAVPVGGTLLGLILGLTIGVAIGRRRPI